MTEPVFRTKPQSQGRIVHGMLEQGNGSLDAPRRGRIEVPGYTVIPPDTSITAPLM
jgi:hypothetical protein